MTILDCCFASVEHTRKNGESGDYTVRYVVTTNVPYSPNSLIALMISGGCIDTLGTAYPGFPTDVITVRSAISAPDFASTLRTIDVDKGVNLEGGDRLRYVVTLNYQIIEGKLPDVPPTGETSNNPLDWCPLYRERSVPREVEADKAIFKGLYDNSDEEVPCVLDQCDCTLPFLDLMIPFPAPGELSAFRVFLGDCVTPINTAGDKITGITKIVSDTEVSVTRWFAIGAFDPDLIRCKRDTVNQDEYAVESPCWGEDPFITIAPETGLIEMDWTLKATTDIPGFPIFRYWEVTYRVLVRDCGWIVDLLNEGLNRIVIEGTPDGHGGIVPPSPDGARAYTVQILQRDNKGQTVSRPVPLDRDGQPIQSGDPTATVQLRWQTQLVADWTGIGL